MVLDSIPEFDSYVFIAIGLFVTGLFATMVYEKLNSKPPNTSKIAKTDK